MAGFDYAMGLATQNKRKIENIGTSVNIEFEKDDARIFGELGLPTLQGWTSTNDSLFTDTVFDVEKEVIKFTDGDANKYVGSAKWTNILNFGASYSGVIRFESRTSSNSILLGLGFSNVNDPRPSSIRSRILLRVNMDSTYTTIGFEGNDLILDGQNGRPLVLINEWFSFEAVIQPTPDNGVNFGAIDLYVNGVFVQSGELISASNNAVSEMVKVAPWSPTGEANCLVDNFGITIYEDSSSKLLTAEQMDNDTITIITPNGKRDYIVILPDGSPRKIGNIFRLVASNALGYITLNSENLNVPEVLFNGENSYMIQIESKESILFTNVVNNANFYEGTIPHEDVMPHEHEPSSYDLSSVGTHIIEGPADMDIIGIDPSNSTKIITIAPFKLLTIIATEGILSIQSILAIPVGVEVTNSLPAFSGHWIGVRDTGGAYEFFSTEKRLDFNTSLECPIGRADRSATDISAIVSLPELGFGYAQTLYDFLATTGSKRLSGGDLQVVNSTKTLKRLEGNWWRTFAGKDENNPHKMLNTENNPVSSYEIHSSTGNVEVVSEMEVGFIDDGAGGKTAIAPNQWSFYLCYHWSRFEGVGFEGFQRSTRSFNSVHDAKSLKGAVGDLHSALDAAVLTHIIYIKGDATDFGNPEQCDIEWVRKDSIGSSGDPVTGSLQQSGVLDWVETEGILRVGSSAHLFQIGGFSSGLVNRDLGLIKYVKSRVGSSFNNSLTLTNPFTYVGYNIETDYIAKLETPMPRTSLNYLIPVGRIWHRDNTSIDLIQNMPLVAETNHDQAGQLLAFGALKQSGLIFSANGANKKINISAGILEVLGGTFDSRENINICDLPSVSNLSMTPIHRAVTTGNVVMETVTSDIDFDVYDDGSGTIAQLSSQQYGIHYFYIFPYKDTHDIFLIRGDESYSTLEDARNGLKNKPVPIPTNFKSGFSLAAIIAKKLTSDLQGAITAGDAIIISADRFGSFGANR